MIVYHGTTNRHAHRISVEGFLPKKPSRRVWFAKGRGYALRRAKTQARRAHDRAVVLTCDLNIEQMREKLGKKRVIYRNGIIAVDGSVPVTSLRSRTGAADQPSTPEELAAWVNQLLRLKPHKGVSRRHPGINRLSHWVENRLATQNRSIIRKTEMLDKARQWLPEYFEDVVVDPESLHAYYTMKTIEVDIDHESIATEEREREGEAIDYLIDERPKRRIKGLSILARIEDPDLFDWCVMFLDDDSNDVRIAALHTMLQCDDGEPEIIAPLAESEDRRIRGAAIAAIAKHSGRKGPRWVEFGLKDPSPCVRVETAAVLSYFDPCKHRKIFDLALHDPNRDVARRAKTLSAGKDRQKGD